MTRHLIIEADGGSRGNPGPAAYGALVRDGETGEVLAEIAEAIGIATNNVAEYRGLTAGLRAAADIDPSAVLDVRLDSKLLVEQMSGRWKIKNPELRALALEARQVFPVDRVTYTWVPRAENAAADRLVNQALDGEPGGGTSSTVDAVAASEPTAPANRLLAWAPELGPPTSLMLVRHGQTALTTARRFSGGGVEGPPLDETGRRQAARMAARLEDSGVVSVVASPMLRTRQTAEIIAARLGVAVRVDDGWREVDFGAWEGLTLGEVSERFPAETAAWHESTAYPPPSGESLDAMSLRVTVARDRAVARFPGQRVVVVTHSMPVRALIRGALGAPSLAMFRLQPAPGSLSQLDTYNDGTQAVTSFSQLP